MGFALQTESRTAEFVFAVECEYSPRVIEFWDQPPAVPVQKVTSQGGYRRASYTPDYLLLNDGGPEVIEVKTRSKLESLVSSDSNWIRVADNFEFVPGREFFKRIGLAHKVVFPEASSQIRSSNLRLLMRCRVSRVLPDADFRTKVKRLLLKHAYIRLSSLAKLLAIEDLTPLLVLIDEGELRTLIDEELLSLPESCWVACSDKHLELAKLANAQMGLQWTDTAGSDPPDSIVPSQADAMRISSILERIASNDASRSARRYRRQVQVAREQGKSVVEALADRRVHSGNTRPQLYTPVNSFLEEWIRTKYASKTRPTIRASWCEYKEAAQQAHPLFAFASYKTFRLRLQRVSRVEIARGRGGRRAANAAESATPVQTRGLVAQRPFERAAMDHYLADVYVRILIYDGSIVAVRPWVSLLIDSCTKAVLAVWVSLRAPSRRQVGLLLRLCVRKHGRLPETIIVDRGAEFRSHFINVLLARYGVHKELRPAEDPKYGSEAERINGIFIAKWAALRPGNLACRPEARSTSGSHSPDKQAILTPALFWEEFMDFSEWYNSFSIGTRREPPQQVLETGLASFPISGVPVTYAHELVIATSVDSNEYTVDPKRGIHIGPHHYWHPTLSKVVTKKSLEVRIDPENPYRVYCLLGGEWLTCLAGGDQQFRARSLVAQREEALWVLDGTSARTQARDAADIDLIKRIRKADGRLTESTTPPEPKNREASEQPTSLFSNARSKTLDDAVVRQWRN